MKDVSTEQAKIIKKMVLDKKTNKEESIMVGQITGKNELKKNGSGYSDPTAYKAIMNVGGQQ